MSFAALCAGLSGVLAAAAVGDLARGRPARPRPRAPGRRSLRMLLALGRRLGAPAPSGGLAALLRAAGSPLGLSPADATAAKAGAALGAALLAIPLATAMPGRLGLVLLAGAPAGGFLAPDLWLRRRARRRAGRLAAELPDVLDLLRVAVEAGLPVMRALGDVGRRHAGELAAELRSAAAASELGVPRETALAELTARAPLEPIAALVAAIGRSERHGAPLSPALTALAADARAERARRLAEHAARAAPKIQLAVALLLVPAAMLVVAAGAVSAFAGS